MRRIIPAVLCLFLIANTNSIRASQVRASDEEVLTNAGVALTPAAVIDALAHENAFVRRSAAGLLGKWQNKSAIPNLKRLLDDKAAFVRIAAAGSLLRMGDKSGMAELVEELSAPEVGFAVRAATLLLEASDPQGFEAIKSRLASGKVAPLDRLLIERFFAYALRVPSLREEAEALVIKALIEDDDRYVRLAAAEDLAQHHSPAIVRAFETIVKDEQDPLLRKQAKAYLDKEATRKRE
jgi:HEAT repeat protein